MGDAPTDTQMHWDRRVVAIHDTSTFCGPFPCRHLLEVTYADGSMSFPRLTPPKHLGLRIKHGLPPCARLDECMRRYKIAEASERAYERWDRCSVS
jgi:hypothetical protein